ncbi:MAG TPA: hypothetical protein PLT69_02505, partial [Deltaproteobacteria bacterium]|nr:hypothetical protein [Deltaproteobacteria bacterium]
TSPSQPSGSTGSTQATNPAGAATSNPSSSVASSGDTSPNQSADPDPGDADDTQSPPETLPRPVVVSPLDNEADVELTPLLEATPPPGDHWYGQWEISSASGDLVLAATVASPTDGFQVPDLVLEGGTEYYCRVRYHDGSGTYTEWSEPTLFITARDDTEDLDGNGVPDDQEPPAGARVDLDRNGVSDLVQEGMLTILTTEGGMPLSLKASTNCRGIKVFKALDTARGEGFETKPAYLPIGIVDFKMELDRPGDLAEVIVYLPRKAPVGSKWYFFDQRNGWREYPHAVLSEDRLSVTLTLKDGDPDYGDSDGAANGVIVDPGGLGVDGEAASFDESPRDQHLGCFVTATDTDRACPARTRRLGTSLPECSWLSVQRSARDEGGPPLRPGVCAGLPPGPLRGRSPRGGSHPCTRGDGGHTGIFSPPWARPFNRRSCARRPVYKASPVTGIGKGSPACTEASGRFERPRDRPVTRRRPDRASGGGHALVFPSDEPGEWPERVTPPGACVLECRREKGRMPANTNPDRA